MVLISLDEYESLKETIEILSNPKLMCNIRRGIKEFEEGKTINWEDLKKELEAKRKPRKKRQEEE